jgi:hypothetical protein
MNSKLIVNGIELDLSENIAVPLNLSISDVKEPEKRKRSYSKSIKLEGTSNNMAFFVSAYSLSMDVINSSNLSFDPSIKNPCEFYKNDLLIFKGKLKLNEVIIQDKNYYFDCTLFSDVVDIFTKLKDKKLNELDWSEYDHLLTRTNVIKSWSQGIKLNGVDNRNFGADTRGYQPKSYGYIYPLVDYGYNFVSDSPVNFRINQLYPFIYVKEACKKILNFALEGENIEVDYTTDFFTNTNMQKLIYGFGGGQQLKLSSEQTQLNEVGFTGHTNTISYVGTKVGSGSSAYYQTQVTYDIVKIYLQDTITQNVNTIQKTVGTIKINSSANYDTRVFGSFTLANFDASLNTSGNTFIDSKANKIRFYIEVNGVLKTEQNISISTSGVYSYDLKTNISLQAGDVVKLFVSVFARNKNAEFYLTFNALNSNIIPTKEAPVIDNSPVSLSSSIPDIKCSDFFKGILNLFYAYMSDPIYDPITNKSTIIIDSFINYYKNETIYDNWTDKVDYQREISIQSNSLIEGQTYNYRYAEEKDYFNSEYKRLTNLNYGEKQLQINTWQTGNITFELPFNTYVPVKIENSSLIYPKIIEQATDNNGNTTIKPYKGKGMLCFYNGLKSGVVNMYNAQGTATGDWEIKYDFPMIHHLRFKDNYNFEPLFDLHFASRNYSFDGINQIPDNQNVFDKYHAKFVNEITSKNSKLVSLYLNLNYKDIHDLDFSKLKMIDGILYRLNTIKDFDSDAYGTTQVELLKYLGNGNS